MNESSSNGSSGVSVGSCSRMTCASRSHVGVSVAPPASAAACSAMDGRSFVPGHRPSFHMPAARTSDLGDGGAGSGVNGEMGGERRMAARGRCVGVPAGRRKNTYMYTYLTI
eukprot:3972813-Prymnesium_polylepis.1